MCVRVHMHVCMHLCMHACVCMTGCVCVCMHVCEHIYVCTFVCMNVCMNVCVYMCYSHVWKMPRETQLYPSMQGNAETTARFWMFLLLTLHLMAMTQGLTLNWVLSILSILAGLGGFPPQALPPMPQCPK